MSSAAKSQRNWFKKRRAIYLLVACQQDEKTVARELGITLQTLRKWMKQPYFAEQLEKSIQKIENHDRQWRAKQNKILSSALYDEAHRRIAKTRDLQDVPFRTIFAMLKEVNTEIRVDTPGDATSRDEVTHKHQLDRLIERFQERASEEDKPHLKLVELPEDDKKEAANG